MNIYEEHALLLSIADRIATMLGGSASPLGADAVKAIKEIKPRHVPREESTVAATFQVIENVLLNWRNPDPIEIVNAQRQLMYLKNAYLKPIKDYRHIAQLRHALNESRSCLSESLDYLEPDEENPQFRERCISSIGDSFQAIADTQ